MKNTKLTILSIVLCVSVCSVVYIHYFRPDSISILDHAASLPASFKDHGISESTKKLEEETSNDDQNIQPANNDLKLPVDENAEISEPDRFVGTDEEHIAYMNNLVKQGMIDRDVPKHRALMILEMTHGIDTPDASNLDAWLKKYNGELYNPPYEFKYTEPKNDFTTIPFAIHSYWYAMNSGRVASLLKHCDKEFRDDLVSYFNIDPDVQRSYTSENSSFKVLISGSTSIDGVEYYVCLYFRYRSHEPQDAIMGYYEHHFVKKGDSYYFTGAPRFTQFGMVFEYFAGKGVLKAGKYSKVLADLKRSGMPEELLPSVQ